MGNSIIASLKCGCGLLKELYERTSGSANEIHLKCTFVYSPNSWIIQMFYL